MRRLLFVTFATFISFLLSGGAYAMTNELSGSSCSTQSCSTSAAFNTNTSSSIYGGANEANFLRIKNANSSNPGFTSGTIDINDDAVLMQALVNNASTTDIARNATLTITLPIGFATTQTAMATLRADNVSSISDSATMVDSQPFGLSFDQNAQVYIAKRSGTATNNYVNTATNNFQINGNVMTVNLGDWAGGTNQQGLVTVRVLVTRAPAVQLPAFACTGLSRTSIDNNRSTFTASSNGQAAGVNVSSYTFTVKDNTGRVVDTNTVNTNGQSATYNFNQSNSGTYTVTSIANSDKGATSATSTCTQSVTVPTVLSSTTTVTPTASKALPNTGAGDILGIFTGTSALGAGAHYAVRRFRR